MATPEDQTNKFADEEEQQEVGLEDDPSGKRTEGEEEIAPLLVPSGVKLKPYQRLVTEDNVFAWSLWAMRLGVLADSINSTILRPNYPFLVTPGARDAFPSTSPFGFSSAQYFLPMTSLLATAIAATFVGGLSDRIGRRPVMLVCVGFGVIGSIAKFLARSSFWGFCAANFVTGLFGATLAISMAYASDVAKTRAEKDGVIGALVAINMVGATGGGIIAILMGDLNLFAPLFVGAGMSAMATIFGYFFLVEPKKLLAIGRGLKGTEADEEDDDTGPETINVKIASNILFGSLLDNAGSTGLLPFCLSPLAFNAFYAYFVERGEEPLMTQNAFRWIGTMLAIMIIPTAAGSSSLYGKIGAAGGCVLGNFLTALMTIALLQIGIITPATTATFAIFVTVMYVGFPMTVISQLSTGPMLDMIAPASRRGFVQGMNTSVMNFGTAVFPWVFGIIADQIGAESTIWICVGVSFAASIANAPLIFNKELRRKKVVPDYSKYLKGEDSELVERALRGEWVPAAALNNINAKRIASGHHFLLVPWASYEKDKENLREIKNHAKEDLEYTKNMIAGHVSSDMLSTEEKREELTMRIKAARASPEQRQQLAQDLGSWFSHYLMDAGYHVDDSATLYKQMFMSAFPRIKEGDELTPDNIEEAMLKWTKILNHYVKEEEQPGYLQLFARSQYLGGAG